MAKKVDRKGAILDAMLDLVVKRGLNDAPMSVLARKSGASPGVIYHYFPSKDDLIRALYRRVATVKHKALFDGFSTDMSPREALLHIWLNAYRFYRTHRKEAHFLDQFHNSSYCDAADEANEEANNPTVKRIVKWMRPKKHGGVLKELPPEAIDSLTLGLAASLAKSPKDFSKDALKQIAETIWAAIAED
jgi:AcrR family transcriptional regulator